MVRRSLILACAAACGLAVVTVSARQSVDDVIAQNLAAKGGLEKLRAIQSIKQTAKLSMQGMEAVMTVFSKRPNRVRQEIKVGSQTVINGFDGVTPWMINPIAMAGSSRPIAITGPQADSLREQGDFDGPLVDYKSKGYTVAVTGTETVGEKKVRHLEIVSASRQILHLYIDVATNLEVKRTTQQDMLKVEHEFSDYRTIEGITLPFVIRTLVNGAPQSEMRVQSVEFNVPVDDAIFRMPRG